MKLTERQAEALDSARHVVLRAGAGSGKTSVLTERYIALLENRLASVREIIAITFTEKAAGQMKEKIREKIQKKIDAAEKTSDAENILFWESIYDDFSEARISTIHAFCASILRDDPVAAGVDPAFEILDENLSSLKLQESISAVLDIEAESASDEISRLPEDWSRVKVEEALRKLFGAGPGIIEWAEFYSTADAEKIMERWKKASDEKLFSIANAKWIDNMLQAMEGIVCVDGGDKQAGNVAAARRWLENLKSNFPDDIGTVSGADVCAMNFSGGKAGSWEGEGFAAWKSIRDEIRDAAKEMNKYVFSEVDDAFAASISGLAALYLKVAEEFRGRCGNGRLIGFDELQTRALEYFKKQPAATKEFMKSFRYIMVDEFQDTNPLQWEIVKLVSGAAGGFEKNVFIVGDEKQSIYGFRGADVKVFGKAENEIAAGGKPGCASVALDVNFRSRPELVEFYNLIFGGVFSGGNVSADIERISYEDVNSGRNADGGGEEKRVEFICVSKEQGKTFGGERYLEAEMVAERLWKMLHGEKPFMVSDEDGGTRPVREDDMAVLFRKTTHASKYEEAFRNRGLNFINIGGYGFFDADEIADVMNALKFLYDRRNEVALAGALRSPLFGLSDETLFRISLQKGKSFLWKFKKYAASKDADERAVKAAGRLLRWGDYAGREKTTELITRILDESGGWGVYCSGERGRQGLLNLEKLLELAAGFEASEGGGLGRFMRWYEMKSKAGMDESEAQMSGEEGGGVRFLTVHRAKGLEFPVVVVQNASFDYGKSGGSKLLNVAGLRDGRLEVGYKVFEDGDGGKSNPVMYNIVSSSELEAGAREEKRLLYVACTRAMEKLIIAGCSAELAGDAMAKDEKTKTWTMEINNALRHPGVRERINELADWIMPDSHPAPVEASVAIVKCDYEGLKNQYRNLLERADEESGEASPRIKVGDGLSVSVTELNAYIKCCGSDEGLKDYVKSYVTGVPPSWSWHESGEGHHHHPVISPVVRGEAVHRLFEELHDSRPKEIRRKLAQILLEMNAPPGRETDALLDKYVAAAEKFLKSDVGARAMSGDAMKEVPFLLEAGPHAISGKIDMMYFDGEGKWKIVDYKTNVIKPGREDHTLEDYRTQMEVYALAVLRARGAEEVSSMLYFTETAAFSSPVTIKNKDAEELLRKLSGRIDEIQELKRKLLYDDRF